MRRRDWLLAALAAPASARAAEEARVVPRPLAFPRDFGAHEQYQVEWWYVTGALRSQAGAQYGWQITFFRSRTGLAGSGRFAPRPLLFAPPAPAAPNAGRWVHR